MWHIWQSPALLPASGYQSRMLMAYLVVGKCGIWQSPAPLPASGYQSRMVMAYLVVGKCGTSGNPLHHCLLQVISPERLWLTWLLVNVAHLAIPCTAACFKFRLLWLIRSTRISACLGASPTLGFCVSISVSVISNCDQLWVSVSSCSFRSSSY